MDSVSSGKQISVWCQDPSMLKPKSPLLQLEVIRQKEDSIRQLIKISSEIVIHTQSISNPSNSADLVEAIKNHLDLLKKQKSRIENILAKYDELT